MFRQTKMFRINVLQLDAAVLSVSGAREILRSTGLSGLLGLANTSATEKHVFTDHHKYEAPSCKEVGH